jgi:hypothetical protein
MRLMAVFVPVVFVLVLLINHEGSPLSAGLERLLLVVALVTVAVLQKSISAGQARFRASYGAVSCA